ncbi:MAG: hypothetical protein Ta2D_12980 [Rickettsiales bacterium]|nr:MAG: hypothetical protein Ta2D_12980 [Rickettsiales bacterium]
MKKYLLFAVLSVLLSSCHSAYRVAKGECLFGIGLDVDDGTNISTGKVIRSICNDSSITIKNH